jgi:hypothetical protein
MLIHFYTSKSTSKTGAFSGATSLARSMLIYAVAVKAPAINNDLVIASHIPLPAPVTIATRSVRSAKTYDDPSKLPTGSNWVVLLPLLIVGSSSMN